MIFILGGNGFVGSAIARFCSSQGWEHRVIGRANYTEFVGQSCDLLINANGNSKKFVATREPTVDFEMSVLSVQRSLFDFEFRKYVFFSSADVYPETTSPETTCETTEIDITKQSRYGFHKYLAEQIVRHGCADWTIFRLGGMVGPNLVKNPIYDLLNSESLFVHPDSEMQFLHTSKVAELTFELHPRLSHKVLNLVADDPISLRKIWDLLPLGLKKTSILSSYPEDAKPFRYEINAKQLVSMAPSGLKTASNLITFFSETLAKSELI